MDLMSFLHFSFGYCVTVLAWPLLALVYPICASIRAIETNSFSDSQTLNAYWVVLSLMLLLEHGFMKLFGWSLSWQYIKITIICFLVIPYFDGASYVYNCFIRPLIFTGIHIIINWFQTHKESKLPRESFLDELDKYVKEYGTEAVEKILTDKSNKRELEVLHKDIKAVESNTREPEVLHKNIKVVEVTEKNEVMSNTREPEVLHKNIEAVEVTEKNEVMEIYQDQSNTREPEVLHKNIKAVEVTKKNEVMEIYQDQSNTREPEVLHKNIKAMESNTREPEILQEDIKVAEVTKKNEVMTIYQDQSKTRELEVLHKNIKAVEVTEKNEVMEIYQDQSNTREPEVLHKNIKAMEVTEKNEVMKIYHDQSNTRESEVLQEDIKVTEVTKKNEVMTIYQDQFYSREPDVLHEDIKALEVTEKNEVMTIDQVSQIEPSFIKTKISCDVIHETQKETTLNPPQSRHRRRAAKWASSDIQKAESGTMPIIENVQVWLKSVPPDSSATNSNKLKKETAKAPLSSEMKQEISTKDKEKIEKQHKKIPNKQTVEVKAPSLWCDLCKISCPCVIVMESHLKGRKHQARIQFTTAM